MSPNPCSYDIANYNDVPTLACLGPIIARIINLLLTFLGAVALLLLLWGAIQFVISRGDPKAIQTAQKTMTFAVIGVVVVLGSVILINVFTTAFNLPNILTSFSVYQP
jgi:hypothetical protein